MKRTIFILFLLMSVSLSTSYAQESISGTVYLETNDEVGVGATIRVKNSTTGAITDLNGQYSIQASQGDVLVASFVGYATQEQTVSGSTVNFVLESSTTLDNVVVVGFGTEKDERSLGYSVQEVSAEDINMNGQVNSLQALQGKVSGVQINRASGAPGGGVDVLIRGVTSMNPTRDNQPLIIVDGIVINNDVFAGNVLPSAGSNSPSSQEQFSFANRAIDLNPEDISTYNILKGAAATALYGHRASNGAIVITTKRGRKGTPKVNVSASTSFRTIEQTPDLQTTYREGWRGEPRLLYNPSSESGFTRAQPGTVFWSWGPEYSVSDITLGNGDQIDLSNDQFYSPYDIFDTAKQQQINANVSGANDFMNYFISFGKNGEDGILPGTDFDKTNFRINTGFNLMENLKLSTSIGFTDSDSNQAPAGDKSVMSSLSYFSGSFPINDFQNSDGSQRDFSFGIIDNPRYLLQNSDLTSELTRWIGNAQLEWNPTKELSLTYMAQVDTYSNDRNRFVPPNVDLGSAVGGYITEQNIGFDGIESNFLARYTKPVSEKFTTSFMVGNQFTRRETDYLEARGETLNVPGVRALSNTINPFSSERLIRQRDVGVFGEAVLEYDNNLFLTLTGRNSWLSTLPKENRSFFYPSASLAYDVTSLFDNVDNFDFGKLRVSWAEVGKGPEFGQIGSFFISDGDFPFGGTGGYRSDISIGDPNIVPEETSAFEIGADLRFLDGRLRFDYAYYTNRVKDQIFPVSTALSSGIASYVRNAGDFKTYGHEALLSYRMFDNKDFQWDATVNWSTNEGEVLDLPDDLESIIFVSSGFAGVTSEVREGDKLGSLYGWRWTYNDQGQRIINDSGFAPIDFSERQIAGNAFPDFIAAFDNTFRFKGLSLNALLEWKEGGDIYDAGLRNGIRNGVRALTEFRNQETVLEGVLADGTVNTQSVTIDQDYYRNSTIYNRASEILVQDASWLKFRNLSLTYELDDLLAEKLRANNVSATASANNIILWTPFDGFDPEGNQYSAGSNVYGFTGLNLPLPQTYSFGLNFGF